MVKTGLFFGSFNPIHIGHLILAEGIAEAAGLDQVWFVVSPQNPFKKKSSLLHEFDRMHMVRLAIADNPRFRASDIEFNMPTPNYTIDTLTVLSEKYPQHSFQVIVGQDNLEYFHKWKNSDKILEYYGLLVYPRSNIGTHELEKHPKVTIYSAPQASISATFIRDAIKNGKSIRYLVPEDVYHFIKAKKLYL